jgi:spore coat polysaccharide biosynthesis protein SpsF
MKLKVVCIVQARMASTRLPGKVSKKIEGKPMLEHLIERLKRSKLID